MRHAVAAALAFVLFSAGTAAVLSTGDSDVVEAMAGGGGAGARPSPLTVEAARAGVEAPRWDVGHAWQLLFDGGNAPCTVGVVQAGPDGYLQGFRCPEGAILALQEAVYDLPHVGAFSAELASLSQGDEVRFFDWPLVDGKSWSFSMGGNDYDVTARFVEDLPGPFGPEPGYVMEAEFDGGSDTMIRYDYLPSIGWWTTISFANGGYTAFRVVDFTTSYGGALFTATGKIVMQAADTAMPTPTRFFSVGEEAEFLFVEGRTAGQFYAEIELRSPTGTTAYGHTQQQLTTFGTASWSQLVDAEPGLWEMRVTGAGTQTWSWRAVSLDVREWR